MFISMFISECKQLLKSFLFWGAVIFLSVFIIMQMPLETAKSKSLKPIEGQDYYGITYSKKDEDVIKATLAKLVQETDNEKYATYTMGIYKEVVISKQDRRKIVNLIESATDKTWENLVKEKEEYFLSCNLTQQATDDEIKKAQCGYVVVPRGDFNYEKFESMMETVVDIIGEGSSYDKNKYGTVEVLATYDEAIEEYNSICNNDKGTNALMRLFCDYAGMILAFLPVFLGCMRWLKDEKADVYQVIQSKKASTTNIVLSRYFSQVVLMFFSVLVLAAVMEGVYIESVKNAGISWDFGAFFKYVSIWILPQIMFIYAMAFFLSEWIGYIGAIIIQVGWGIISILGGSSLVGNFRMHLVLRWNIFGGYDAFAVEKNSLYINRGFYMIMAIFILTLTIIMYELHRSKGRRIGERKKSEEADID